MWQRETSFMQNNKTPTGAEQQKRGRGRPRKADALTDAERAARYRARKKEKMKGAQDIASIPDAPVASTLLAQAAALSREVEEANKQINDLAGALDVVVSIASKGKLIPADVLAGLYRLLSSR
jgi:predicted ArsR family transcriptional regulator